VSLGPINERLTKSAIFVPSTNVPSSIASRIAWIASCLYQVVSFDSTKPIVIYPSTTVQAMASGCVMLHGTLLNDLSPGLDCNVTSVLSAAQLKMESATESNMTFSRGIMKSVVSLVVSATYAKFIFISSITEPSLFGQDLRFGLNRVGAEVCSISFGDVGEEVGEEVVGDEVVGEGVAGDEVGTLVTPGVSVFGISSSSVFIDVGADVGGKTSTGLSS